MRCEAAAIFAGETRGVPPGPPDVTVSNKKWVGGAHSWRTEMACFSSLVPSLGDWLLDPENPFFLKKEKG
jgi:hypothetical protein